MPRNQGNPFMFFIFMLPLFLAMFKTFTRVCRQNNSTRNPVPIPVPVPVPIPVPVPVPVPIKVPKKDFLIMEEWNAIIKPENYVQPEDLLLTPEPNKGHWYTFLVQ